jgi:hypothetical protein
MNKIVIPTILAATVLVAGFVAYLPVQKAQTVHTFLANVIAGNIAASVRDNTTVTNITNVGATGTRMILLDNAGIGTTSDVEITWRFSDDDCQVQVFDGVTFIAQANDGAFGGNPPHADFAGAEAVALVSIAGTAGDGCTLAGGDFVTVSTVGV